MKSWLISELQAAMSAPDVARFALDLTEDVVTLIERTSQGATPTLSADVHGDRFDDEIAAIRKRVGGRGRVDLLLPTALTLFRIDTFPGEARKNLREEAWWRLDALTPYAPEDLCYDVSLLGADQNTGFLEVHIAVAPREIVDEAIGYARGWGFTPRRVTSGEPAIGFPAGPEFLTVDDPASETRSLRRGAALATAAVLLFGVIGVTRGVIERQRLVEEALTRSEGAQETLGDTLQVRAAALDLANRAMTPSVLRETRPLAVDLLAALARAMPPKTLTERAVITENGLRIEGVSANADAVLSAVALAPEFRNGRYAAPVETLSVRGRKAERFVIEAEIAPIERAAPVREAALSGEGR